MLKDIFKFQINNYWRNIDKNILFGFFILFFLGLFFSFSSTSSLAGERLNKDYYFFFSKHLAFTLIALLIMFIISVINTSLLKKIITPLFVVFFISLILVPIIGVEVKGAKRWLDLYFFRLQPIELLKPFFILITAKILTSNKLNNSQIKYLFSFMLLASVIILLIDQPDLGQSILLTGSWIATIFISGVSLIYILCFFFFFIVLISGLLFLMREGTLKYSVPEAHTDYIIAIVSEEYGSIISIIIISIFLYISFRIIKNCIEQKNEFVKLSLCGLSSLLIFQTFIHIGVNTSLLPTTGMTLPFLSYGGSSLIGSAVLAGVILNYTKIKLDLNE